jgi:hypothetical protein
MTRLLEIDAPSFVNAFAIRSLAVRHSLVGHPLLKMDAIAELADRLPPTSVRREGAGLPVANGRVGYVDVGVGRPSETIRQVEENGVRVSLRDIQQVPEYAELINECLDEVDQLVGDQEGGMRRRAGYLFISSPAATTPMHYDVEHSFLLQVRGAKNVSVATFSDPATRMRELDRYLDGVDSDFEAMQEVAETTHLAAGIGVYLPSYVPHWVDTEAGVSVSFSIPFYTPYCERAAGVYGINKRLRQLRMSPRPFGEFATVDRTKAAVFDVAVKLRSLRSKLPA